MKIQEIEEKPPRISFVIPLFNESESLAALAEGIESECAQGELNYEIILVDDGSTDPSWPLIVELAKENPRIHGIKLRRRSGKGSALTAGFAKARGEIIFTLDADGQDRASDIPKFLQKINAGWDFVVGWRRVRNDPFQKRMVSKVYNFAIRSLVGTSLHDHNCGFKCFRSETVKNLCLYGETHRFFPLMVYDKGYRLTEVEVDHFPRRAGKSKYGYKRLLEGGLDFATFLFLKRFKFKPLHLLGLFGLVAFFVGLTGMTYLAVMWMGGQWIGGRPLLIYSAIAMLFGFQCFITGLLAELLISYNVRKDDMFQILASTDSMVASSRSISESTVELPLLQ